MGDHHIPRDENSTTAAPHTQSSVVMRASLLTSRHKAITDMGMTERGGALMEGMKGWYEGCSRDGERRGFDDKKLWESERVRRRDADVSTYESPKTEGSQKNGNTERARGRNRLIKLSVAPLAMIDRRDDVDWLFQQRDGFVLMSYSTAKGGNFVLFFCSVGQLIRYLWSRQVLNWSPPDMWWPRKTTTKLSQLRGWSFVKCCNDGHKPMTS